MGFQKQQIGEEQTIQGYNFGVINEKYKMSYCPNII